jgi:hypothetical protein
VVYSNSAMIQCESGREFVQTSVTIMQCVFQTTSARASRCTVMQCITAVSLYKLRAVLVSTFREKNYSFVVILRNTAV